MDFEDATALTPRGSGRYVVDLREEYAIAGVRPNGGYMLACLGRAAVAAARAAGSPHAHPVATGAQYVTSPELGEAEIETEVLRVGRTATQVTAHVGQNGRTGVAARFTLATLPEPGEPFWGGLAPVELPPIDQCVGFDGSTRRSDTSVVFDPATSVRFTPDGPTATGDGELRAWFDAGDAAVDPVMLLFVADALPPATFSVVATGWVPTLDLSVYIRTLPVPGPLRMRFRTQMIQDGFADEVCEAWDAAGRLVLQSTQLTALRHPLA